MSNGKLPLVALEDLTVDLDQLVTGGAGTSSRVRWRSREGLHAGLTSNSSNPSRLPAAGLARLPFASGAPTLRRWWARSRCSQGSRRRRGSLVGCWSCARVVAEDPALQAAEVRAELRPRVRRGVVEVDRFYWSARWPAPGEPLGFGARTLFWDRRDGRGAGPRLPRRAGDDVVARADRAAVVVG